MELAGDILQFGIPALALGMTGYRRDLAGAGYLTASRSFIATPPYPYTADDIHLIPAE